MADKDIRERYCIKQCLQKASIIIFCFIHCVVSGEKSVVKKWELVKVSEHSVLS